MKPCRVPRLQTLVSDLKHLHDDYHHMPREVRDATLCSVVNNIAHIMHWKFVPLCRYEQHLNRLILTGFPITGYPQYYRINERQVRYLLHKMKFTHARIYAGSTGDTRLTLQRKHLKHGIEGHYTYVERLDPWKDKRYGYEHDPHDPDKHEHNYENILTTIDDRSEASDRYHSYDKPLREHDHYDRPPY